MMGLVDCAFLLLFIITELLNYILCYHLIFGVNVTKKKKNWIIALPSVMVFHVVIAWVISPLTSSDCSIVSMLVIPSLLLSGQKRTRYGLYLFIFWGMSSVGSIASLVLSLALNVSETVLLNTYSTILICQIVPSIMLLILFVIIKIRNSRIQKVYLGRSTYILFYVSIVCIMLIQASFQELSEIDNRIVVLCGVVSSAACIVFLIVILWHGISMNRELELREEISSMRQLDKMKDEYFNQVLVNNERIRKFKHDVKGHLLALNGYCKEGDLLKLERYLSNMSDEMADTVKEYTEDKGVNAVIGSLCERGKEKDIIINIRGVMELKKSLSSFEWCSIFYNLIQNAIEACDKLPVGVERGIGVTISNVDSHCCVGIENPVISDIEINNGQIETDKADKDNHGLGIRNVTDIVEQHNGIIRFSCEGKVFRANVVI